MSFAPRAVLAVAVLGSVWPGTRACRGPGWKPLGDSDLGPDAVRATGPGGSAVWSVSFPSRGSVTVEWLDPRSGSLFGRTWNGRGWSPPVALTGAERALVARATPDGWSVLTRDHVGIHRAGRREELVWPERPMREFWGCTSMHRADPYLGPVRVAFDPTGTAWLFEPIDDEINAWWREGDVWMRAGAFHATTMDGDTLGSLGYRMDDGPVPSPPAVVFDAHGHPIVAWTLGGVAETRQWTGAEWRDLGEVLVPPTSEAAPVLARSGDDTLALAAGGRLYTQTPTTVWSPLHGTHSDTALAALPDGRLVRASTWTEPHLGMPRILAEVLTGGEWSPVGGQWRLHGDAPAAPAFAQGPRGELALSWWDDGVHVATWDGVGFRLLALAQPGPGLTSTDLDDATLRTFVDGGGRPTVTWSVPKVPQWSRGVAWTGTEWSSLSHEQATAVDGAPWALHEVPGPLPAGADPQRLASTLSGRIVAWVAAGPATERIELRRWNGRSWTAVGDPVVAECDGTCREVAVAEGGGRICVAWTEPAGVVWPPPLHLPSVRLALRCRADR